MPQVLLTESVSILGAMDPWPNDVKLFQPFEVEQILLPENATCLSVQAFLHMNNLPFSIEMRNNAEQMSPSGRVPFIRAGAFVIADLDPILAFVSNKGISLTQALDETQKADMRAYMSLINTVLATAELYITWLDPNVYEEVTKPRYGSVYAWPLNRILTYQKCKQIEKKLKVLGWKHKKLQEVYAEVDNCCNALSDRLDKHSFFFGDAPTELDALAFGHLYTILTTPLPDNKLASIVKKYENLASLCRTVEKLYFNSTNDTRILRSLSNGNGSSSSNGEDYDKLEDYQQIPK